MPRHRREHDDGSPCCSHKPWLKDAADGWGCRGTGARPRVCSKIHNQDIPCKHRLKATLVKWPVMGHEWQTLNQRFYLRPYFREGRLTVRISPGKTMNLSSPVCIIIGCRLYETVEFINNLASAYHYNADAAHTASPPVGSFKIYCNKILHGQSFL